MARSTAELVGRFFDNHWLSIINRNIALELAAHGEQIDLVVTPRDRPDPKWKVDKTQIRRLTELASRERRVPDVQVRHVYPPIWEWPRDATTKVIYIQPWTTSAFRSSGSTNSRPSPTRPSDGGSQSLSE